MKPAQQQGFTLIELMIVVAIVGIIAAFAYPSYQSHVEKSRRADGQAALMELAQRLERCYTARQTYENDAGDALCVDPANYDTDYYALTADNVSASTFTLNANPTGPQDTATSCGELTLNQAGAKGVENASWTVDECW